MPIFSVDTLGIGLASQHSGDGRDKTHFLTYSARLLVPCQPGSPLAVHAISLAHLPPLNRSDNDRIRAWSNMGVILPQYRPGAKYIRACPVHLLRYAMSALAVLRRLP